MPFLFDWAEVGQIMPHFFCACKRNPAERKHDQEGDTTLCPPLNNLPPCAANLSPSARLAREMCAGTETATPPHLTAAYKVAAAKPPFSYSTVQSFPPPARNGAKVKAAWGGDCTRGGTKICPSPLLHVSFATSFRAIEKKWHVTLFCTRKRNREKYTILYNNIC